MESREGIFYLNISKVCENLFNKKMIVLLALLLLSITPIYTITPNTAIAENDDKFVKSVTIYKIESGDTIWSIAEAYYTPECGKLSDYVREIKKSNNITLDTIYTGCYLIIPYYKQHE